MNPAERSSLIEHLLRSAFAPSSLSVIDESHKHAGHAGARDGRGHFAVEIVAEAFRSMPPLARHRAVYAALGTLMQTDIHALSIKAEASRSGVNRDVLT
jgi:BolA family transcriptional regulator, general stress-responsive regulator